MSATLNLIAAVMMVLHASFGCCWHHAHPSSLETAEASSVAAASASHRGSSRRGCCGAAHRVRPVDRVACVANASETSPANAPPAHDGESCDEVRCSLVATTPLSAAVPNAADAPAAEWFFPADPLASSSVTLSSVALARDVDLRGSPDGSLRPLLGVWRL